MFFGEGKLDDRRPCLVDGSRAYFHRWMDADEAVITVSAKLDPRSYAKLTRDVSQRLLQSTPLPNCVDAQIVRHTYGLIEYLDGTVEQVKPERIKFTDN